MVFNKERSLLTLGGLQLRSLQAVLFDVIDVHKTFQVSHVGKNISCCHRDAADLRFVPGLKETCTAPLQRHPRGASQTHTDIAPHTYIHTSIAFHRHVHTGPLVDSQTHTHIHTHRAHDTHTNTRAHIRSPSEIHVGSGSLQIKQCLYLACQTTASGMLYLIYSKNQSLCLC